MVEYPEHAWQPWNFSRNPRGTLRALVSALDDHSPFALAMLRVYLEETCQIEPSQLHPERITEKIPRHALRFLNRIGGLERVLGLLYPNNLALLPTTAMTGS